VADYVYSDSKIIYFIGISSSYFRTEAALELKRKERVGVESVSVSFYKFIFGKEFI
jgi:hypothetical protein